MGGWPPHYSWTVSKCRAAARLTSVQHYDICFSGELTHTASFMMMMAPCELTAYGWGLPWITTEIAQRRDEKREAPC